MPRHDTRNEEWPENSLVYLRKPGRAELCLVNPETRQLIVIPVSTEQVIRLAADAAGFLPWLLREK